MEKKEKKYTISQAQPKIEHYCSYQERCHQEVKSKLYDYGLNTDEVNEVLSKLVKSNFLNEERFAIAFATGKFRQKKWGLKKIIYELKAKQISDFCIKKAISVISEDDYDDSIKHLAEKHLNKQKKGERIHTKIQKTIQYLISKGYEYEKSKIIVNKILIEQT